MTEQLKTIKAIHLALCLGVTASYVFLGDLTSIKNLQINLSNTSTLTYLLIPIGAYFISNFLYKGQLSKVDKKLSLEEKFPFYQTASIMRWGILEGSAFIILFLNPDLVFFGLLIIIYLFLIYPTQDRMKRDFEAFQKV
ncbi:MAG: MFS transporter [Flavobacteriaceae bacterium]|nr:MFS transporter [Flavobacteriaceae bacterium]HPF96567.1 MFS transporter [Mangrovimonas sp.]HRV55596.1 MFS transporter [Mangrovimonas sp.]